MDRKAQGMSLNVIVVAVIVLIILVVLVLIFTGKVKFFGSKTTETSAQFSGNKCLVPGTNNECGYSREDCMNRGGSYDENFDKYDDCGGTCCLM